MKDNSGISLIPPKVMYVFAGLWFILAAILLFGSISNIIRYNRLEERCTMQVTLQPKNIDEGIYHGWSSTGGTTRQTTYTLDYSFEANGRSYEVSHEFKVPASIRKKYTEADYYRPITVMADPAEPTAIIWGDEGIGMFRIMRVCGFISIAVGLVMCSIGRKNAKKRRSQLLGRVA